MQQQKRVLAYGIKKVEAQRLRREMELQPTPGAATVAATDGIFAGLIKLLS